MELKKFRFTLGEYDAGYHVVFAENLEEALRILNIEEEGEDEENWFSLEDYFEIEEEPIKNPSKAYKGCYYKEDCPWYDC